MRRVPMLGLRTLIFLAMYSISSFIRSSEKLCTLVYQLVPCTQNVQVKGEPRLVSIMGGGLPSKNSSWIPVSQGNGISSTSFLLSHILVRTVCPSGVR